MISIRRILVPTDFGDCSAPAVRYAAELAEKFGAELILLHVVQDLALAMPDAVMPTPVPGPDLGQLIDAGKTGLANLIARENLSRLNPRSGSPRRFARPRDRGRRDRSESRSAVRRHARPHRSGTPVARESGRAHHPRSALPGVDREAATLMAE